MGRRQTVKRQVSEGERAALAAAPLAFKNISFSADEILQRFGERVREIRVEKGISQESLALLSDVDRGFMGRVERGEQNLSLVNIYKIARGLSVPAKELMP